MLCWVKVLQNWKLAPVVLRVEDSHLSDLIFGRHYEVGYSLVDWLVGER